MYLKNSTKERKEVMENTKKFLEVVVKEMAIGFAILSLLFILSEFIPNGNGESQTYYKGQQFLLEGTGNLYVEGEDCIVILQFADNTVKTVIPQKDDISGTFRIIDSISGQATGRLMDSPLNGCTIRTNGLKSEFDLGLLGLELRNILIFSFLLTSMAASINIIIVFLINKFSN